MVKWTDEQFKAYQDNLAKSGTGTGTEPVGERRGFSCPECGCHVNDALSYVSAQATGVERFRCRCKPPKVYRKERGKDWVLMEDNNEQ